MKPLYDQVGLTEASIAPPSRLLTVDRFQGYHHWHQCFEFLFIHQGKGTVVAGRRTYELGKGMLFVFQPFQLHRIQVEASTFTPYERTIFYFDPVALQDRIPPLAESSRFLHRLWQEELPEQGFDLSEDYEWMSGLFEYTIRSLPLYGAGGRDEKLLLLLFQLLSCMQTNDRRNRVVGNAGAPLRSLRYSESIMMWIERHFAEEFQLEPLADDLHLSKWYASRIFRRETGSTIRDYVMVRRVKEACHLLLTTFYSVEQISMEIGFVNVSYFCQIFKHRLGMSPGQYREKHVGESGGN